MTEKTDGVVLRLEIDPKALDSALASEVQATILRGAVEHIISKVTPEALNAWATKLVLEALKGFSSWNLAKELEVVVLPMLREALARPDTQAFLRAEVEKGLSAALSHVSEDVRKRIVNQALESMSRELGRAR